MSPRAQTPNMRMRYVTMKSFAKRACLYRPSARDPSTYDAATTDRGVDLRILPAA